MKKKQSKIIIIVVLVVAGLLGVLAITIALLADRIEDTTPQVTKATNEEYKCESVYVLGKDTNDEFRIIPTTEPVDEGEELIIGAEFSAPILLENKAGTATVTYDSFHFVINGDGENPIIVDASDPEQTTVEQSSAYIFYRPEFTFTDWESLEGKNTLSVTVTAWGDSLSSGVQTSSKDDPGFEGAVEIDVEPQPLDNGTVKECLSIIHDINREVPQDEKTCLEAGETGIDEEIACPQVDEDGDTCDITLPDCCEGLTRVDTCEEPDDTNQCVADESTCFICLSDIGDDVCNENEGENICNSPDDCATTQGDPDPVDPDDPNPDDPNPDDPNPDDPNPDDPNPDDPNPDDPNPDDPDPDDPGYPPVGVETSNFTVTKSGPTCVERVEPLNAADFKITVTNADDSYEDLLQVKDKLPLGFTYVDGSSKINGVADPSDQNVTVNVVGDSQEIIWSTPDGWSVNTGDIFEIEFSTIAGENAISGDVQNEVVVTPVNNPLNSESLRTEYIFKVEQSCTTPETGLFDSTGLKLGAGLIVIFLAGTFYYTSTGRKTAENVYSSSPYAAGSELVDKTKMGFLKITRPVEHFEKSVEKKDKKRRK